MNKVILTGRLTKDIELKNYNNGQNLNCRFVLAVDRNGQKDANGNRQADFISCVAFNQSADFLAKYCHKGDKIGIEGKIQTGSYVNQQNETVYTTDVLVDRLEIESQTQVQQPNLATYGTPKNQPQQNPYAGYNNPSYNQQPSTSHQQVEAPTNFGVDDNDLPF